MARVSWIGSAVCLALCGGTMVVIRAVPGPESTRGLTSADTCSTQADCGAATYRLPTRAPACPVAGRPQLHDEWDLWRQGTCLRGANAWSKRQPAGQVESRSVYPRFERSDFTRLRQWGANLVVLSHPGPYRELPEPGRPNPVYLPDAVIRSNLEHLIDAAGAEGLYVVVAFRTGPGRNEAAILDTIEDSFPPLRVVWEDGEKGDSARAGWVAMWSSAAQWLREKRQVVGYELMVEPEVPESASWRWNELAARLIAAIREHDRATPILIGGVDWSSPCALSSVAKFEDPRVVYTIHQYMPEAYVRCCTNSQGWSSAALERLYAFAAGAAADRERPLVVTEFGVFNSARGADSFLSAQVARIERAGANHALWDWQPSRTVAPDMDLRRAPARLRNTVQSIWRRNAVPRP